MMKLTAKDCYRLMRGMGVLLPNLPALPLRNCILSVSALNIGCMRGHCGRLHRHEFIQFQYVCSGSFSFESATRKYTLREYMGLFIPRGIDHRWSVMHDGVLVGIHLPARGREALRFYEAFEKWCHSELKPFQDSAPQLFTLFLEKVAASGTGNRAIGAHLFGAWLGLAFETCFDANGLRAWERVDASIAVQEDLLAASKHFMQANLDRQINLSDIATELGIGIRQLNRLFAEEGQATPQKYLERCRLEHAHELLQHYPELSIKSVAYACGFASQAYFTNRFRAFFGMTPGAARG